MHSYFGYVPFRRHASQGRRKTVHRTVLPSFVHTHLPAVNALLLRVRTFPATCFARSPQNSPPDCFALFCSHTPARSKCTPTSGYVPFRRHASQGRRKTVHRTVLPSFVHTHLPAVNVLLLRVRTFPATCFARSPQNSPPDCFALFCSISSCAVIAPLRPDRQM